MYLNFGDLGQNAKDYVEQYASKRQGNQEMNSIADMKRFVEEYPEFRKLSSNVTKHITLVGELSRRVGQENLLDVSELEQSLACNDNHGQDLKVITSTFQRVHEANITRIFNAFSLIPKCPHSTNSAL